MRKIEITKKVTDKFTKEAHAVEDIVEKSDERAEDFVSKGYGKYVDKPEDDDAGDQGKTNTDPKKDAELTVSQVKEHVAGVESVDELKELLANEEAGGKRKGALEAIEKRIAELEEAQGGDAE